MDDNKKKFENSKTDLFFLVRELRFVINLIHLALEETNHFDLVINDQSFSHSCCYQTREWNVF